MGYSRMNVWKRNALMVVGLVLAVTRGVHGQVAEFEFTFDGRVVIPVSVNGHGPFQVILDSGLGNSLLLFNHLETGQELGLDYVRTVPGIRGAGTGENKDLHLTAGEALAVPGLDLGTKPVGVIGESRSTSVLHNAGVTGGLLLFYYTVEIDFDASKVRVFDSEQFEAPEGWEEIPLDFAKNLPVLETTLEMEDGSPHPVRLIVDTGGKPQLGLTSDESVGRIPPPDSKPTLTGTGFRGDVFGRLGRVGRVALGSYSLDGMVAGFGLENEAPVLAEIDADGVIGIGALYRFNMIFDFANRRMLIKPNHHFSDPFEWSMAGLALQTDAEGRTMVYYVEPGSTAEAQGLEKGDVVESVNGRPSEEFSYLEMRKVFEQDGEAVELGLRRGDARMTVRLALRRRV